MSIDPMGRAVQALTYWERRQQVVSHDLANVSTPGYRGSRVFARLLEDGGIEPMSGSDASPGAVEETGRSLDVAIEGDGFFVVRTPEGPRYTRNGSFRRGAEGRLESRDGHPVLGIDGPLILPDGHPEIRTDGSVRVDGRKVGRLRVERAAQGRGLRRQGGALFRPEERGEAVEPGAVKIRQGHLESSNVDPVEGMVRMIEVQRSYQAVLRSVQLMDGIQETISGRLGSVE